MIPRTRKQLEETLLALQDLLDGLKGEEAVVETAEYKDAAAAVQKVEEAWAADK
jgi:hypothetical protein